MTTLTDEDDGDLRYAQYVLGVLDAATRTALERDLATNSAAAAAVGRWRRYLGPLAEEAAPEAPPEQLWQRILRTVQCAEPP
jgi:anti-sigma-K factor RskA